MNATTPKKANTICVSLDGGAAMLSEVTVNGAVIRGVTRIELLPITCKSEGAILRLEFEQFEMDINAYFGKPAIAVKPESEAS